MRPMEAYVGGVFVRKTTACEVVVSSVLGLGTGGVKSA